VYSIIINGTQRHYFKLLYLALIIKHSSSTGKFWYTGNRIEVQFYPGQKPANCSLITLYKMSVFSLYQFSHVDIRKVLQRNG